MRGRSMENKKHHFLIISAVLFLFTAGSILSAKAAKENTDKTSLPGQETLPESGLGKAFMGADDITDKYTQSDATQTPVTNMEGNNAQTPSVAIVQNISDSIFNDLTEMERENVKLEKEIKQNKLKIELEKTKAELEDMKDGGGSKSASLTVSQPQMQQYASAPQAQYTPPANNYTPAPQPEPEPPLIDNLEVKEILGTGGNLTVLFLNTDNSQKIKAKAGSTLPDGWVVKAISPENGIVLTRDGQEHVIRFVASGML